MRGPAGLTSVLGGQGHQIQGPDCPNVPAWHGRVLVVGTGLSGVEGRGSSTCRPRTAGLPLPASHGLSSHLRTSLQAEVSLPLLDLQPGFSGKVGSKGGQRSNKHGDWARASLDSFTEVLPHGPLSLSVWVFPTPTAHLLTPAWLHEDPRALHEECAPACHTCPPSLCRDRNGRRGPQDPRGRAGIGGWIQVLGLS